MVFHTREHWSNLQFTFQYICLLFILSIILFPLRYSIIEPWLVHMVLSALSSQFGSVGNSQ